MLVRNVYFLDYAPDNSLLTDHKTCRVPRMQNLTSSQRRIVFERAFRTRGNNTREIMRQAGISRATYYRYKHKLDNGDDLQPVHGERGARRFTAEVRRSIDQLVAQDPEMSSAEVARKLQDRFLTSFSSSGVRKALQSMGHVIRPAEPRQLTAENKRERLNYARRNLYTDWKRIWAYDEVYFNLWKSRHWVHANNHTVHRRAIRKYTNSQESVSLGYAAAISHNKKSDLVLLPKNWRVADLRQLWETELLPSIDWDPSKRSCRAFILDNDGRHHSGDLIDAANLHGLNRGGYLPANSPDLNPAENVWNIMKRYVLRKHPTNERELKQYITEAWETLDRDLLPNLFDSMPERMQAVIDANGDRTAY